MPPASQTAGDPTLTVTAAEDGAEAVVLVLHGGRELSSTPTRASQLAVLRLIPFAQRIHERGNGRAAVARLRFAVRGWNDTGGAPAPVRDARWALDELSRRYPGVPIGLVGHSMGGRTAFRVAGHERVQGVVGLAPWLPATEPVEQLIGRRVLIMHGTADRMTSVRTSVAFARRLQELGVPTSLLTVPGERHGMLRHPRLWHEMTAQFILSAVLPGFDASGWPGAPNDLHELITGQAAVYP